MESILSQLKAAFPITWDRYVQFDNRYTVFGWISRSDGDRDFVIVWFDEGAQLQQISFATSSAKYSKPFSELLGSEHCDCIKVAEHLC